MPLFTGAWSAASSTLSPVFAALIAGSVAAAATAIGTLPALFARRLERHVQDALLGFGAGIMLAASAFSLILPGLEEAQRQGAGKWAAGALVGAAILAGAAMILALDRVIPHARFLQAPDGGSPVRLKRAWMFVFAICLHNLPEGLAIGVGYAAGDLSHGTALATGIAIQDLPEGLVVALALIAVGYPRGWSILVGMASGLIEPVGAVAGASILTAVPVLLPCGLGFAAGAMLYVVSHEVIPEAHREGHTQVASGGLMIGFVLMMVLDTALG